jgi:hypothetical protein
MAMFDTLGLAEDWERAGIAPEQARRMVSALQSRMEGGVATKADLREAVAELRSSLVQWFAGIMVAQGLGITAAVVALTKLL